MKPGDKIIFCETGCMGWESKDPSKHFTLGKEYTVGMVGAGGQHITINEVEFGPDPYEVHPGHFKKK